MAAKAEKPVTVRKYGTGFGLGDGKKWFFYFYKTEAEAQAVLDKTDQFKDPLTRRVNIAQDFPQKLVE
jgi:hypothetical protein